MFFALYFSESQNKLKVGTQKSYDFLQRQDHRCEKKDKKYLPAIVINAFFEGKS